MTLKVITETAQTTGWRALGLGAGFTLGFFAAGGQEEEEQEEEEEDEDDDDVDEQACWMNT